MLQPLAAAFATDSYTLSSGATLDIDEHGVCRDVYNGHASGASIMVPTKTAAEWSTGSYAFLNALPPGVAAGACAPPTLAFTDADKNGNNSAFYSYNNMNIGTASSDRHVVVIFQMQSNTAGAVASAMTIGGITATKLVSSINVETETSFWIANVPTGTTANIVTSLSATAVRSGLHVYTLKDLQSATPYATSTSTAALPQDLSVSVPAGSAVIAGTYADSCPGFTWTGLTEDNDQAMETSRRGGAASGTYTASGSQSISVNGTSCLLPTSALAIWK
ncbi:MAG: hypothetical protein H6922_04185 [Pseudomonadaceae bacterium]|nr:hypothetical protein [Pseudomonadaceae bacterium]